MSEDNAKFSKLLCLLLYLLIGTRKIAIGKQNQCVLGNFCGLLNPKKIYAQCRKRLPNLSKTEQKQTFRP